ncbi:putative Undecaprenyl-phosphate galactosephosphotransferase [Candidatus Sulfotelmatomonas gaucii]|uniref:Putative Undecaprenyl-phosphate galactosephosphotransferase n=1 Tax=Candidatus Sulfuritelmatomonas gaucii TaxID=2043161 RepID=A0A2N9LX66_9BACT|nr:putative Undecaprenyl-phosphate galactosephosphotransferase [Candidatus Sulfotelmatomonas gaucii]
MAAPDLFSSNLRAATIAPLRNAERAIPRDLFQGATALTAASADFLTSALAMMAVCFFCASLPIGAFQYHPMRQDLAISALFGLLVSVLISREGGYRAGNGLLRIQETERAIRVSIQSLLLLFIFSSLLSLNLSWRVLLIAGPAVPPLLALEKQFVAAVVCCLQRRNNGTPRAVIYGSGDTGRSAVSTLLHSPRLGFQPVAVVSNHPAQFGRTMSVLGYRNRPSVAIRPGPPSPSLLQSLHCDLLMVAAQGLSAYELDAARDAAEQAGSRVAFLADPAVEAHQTERLNLDELHFTSNIERRDSRIYAAAKRLTDVTVSSALLLLLAPILVLIAILVRLDSPGPPLFVQKRAGQGGEVFEMFKFRSMYMDAPKYSLSPPSSYDPRITRIGRLLRKMSLDELPQLLNVLMGTMSLVGPRPEMPFIVERYSAKQRQRLQAIPGITGLWQLSADRAFPIHQNIEYDLYYIRNRGFFMDLAILAHTLIFAMSGGI